MRSVSRRSCRARCRLRLRAGSARGRSRCSRSLRSAPRSKPCRRAPLRRCSRSRACARRAREAMRRSCGRGWVERRPSLQASRRRRALPERGVGRGATSRGSLRLRSTPFKASGEDGERGPRDERVRGDRQVSKRFQDDRQRHCRSHRQPGCRSARDRSVPCRLAGTTRSMPGDPNRAEFGRRGPPDIGAIACRVAHCATLAPQSRHC